MTMTVFSHGHFFLGGVNAMRKSIIRTLLLWTVTPILAACASVSYTLGQQNALSGRLVVKGNLPHTYPVLLTASGEGWELQGLSKEEVVSLQNKTLEVQGAVRRLQQPGPQLPLLEVQQYRLKPSSANSTLP
jgi:hypothetical protein